MISMKSKSCINYRIVCCLVFLFLISVFFGFFFYYKNKNMKKIEDSIVDIEEDETIVEESVKEVKLTVVGDLLFETPVMKDILENGNTKYFNRITSKYFANDDITIGNMEVPIGTEDMKISGDGYNFCSPESLGKLIAEQSFEVLSTANNHSYDRRIEGIESTINFFKNNSSIMTVGTYLNDEDRANYRIKDVNGIKFGFLSYTYGTNIGVPSEYANQVAFFRNPFTGTFSNTKYKEQMTEEVNTLREKVDVLIVLIHWGTEFTYTPSNQQKEVANYLNSLGVDVIVGSHSHCMQPIEWIGDEHKTLVYYSMGNFVSADEDISRTPSGQEEFDNSYQVGLLSTFVVRKEDNLVIDSVKTEPIINYFNADSKEFELIPLSDYNAEYESSHYRYKYGMTLDWINNVYGNVISEAFK